MDESTSEPDKIPGDDIDADDRDAKPWAKMLEQAENAFEPWAKLCDSLAKDYADLSRLGKARSDREFQMLYANLEVVKPSIYTRPPVPVVVQRFKEPGKQVERKTSEVLERALISMFDTERVHSTLKHVRDDLALFGRGVVWPRYEVLANGDALDQRVRSEWVHRCDFLHEPARCWPEVGWVARRSWLTKEQGEKRFDKNWTQITYVDAKDTDDAYKIQQKAAVWELWHRGKNVVVWVHVHSDAVLDIRRPYLTLDGFFPCPKPAYGVVEEATLIPVPDPCFYKDQLEEINELTARISTLSESLRLQCFYPAGAADAATAIEAAIDQVNQGENRRVFHPLPVANMMGSGKIDDMIWTLPVRDVAETIVQLVALRKQLIDDVYQISGISDIMRGDTTASETLGAQQLKSQYGSIRIKDRQAEMVRVADDLLNISGEIMAENFEPATMLSMSQVTLPAQAEVIEKAQETIQQAVSAAIQQAEQAASQDPQAAAMVPQLIEKAKADAVAAAGAEVQKTVTVEQVFSLLRSQKLRPFIIQIATDSTIQPDENAEKQARNEFGMAFAQTTSALAPLVAQNPEAADFAGEMLKFMLAPFRAGRQMEGAIDDFVEQMKAKAKQPPPPNPEQMKAEVEAKAMEQDMAAKAAELQERQADRQAKQAQAVIDAKAQQEDRAAEMALRQQEAAFKAAELQHKASESQRQREHDGMMRMMEKNLKELDIVLAQLRLQQAGTSAQMKADAQAANEAFSQ